MMKKYCTVREMQLIDKKAQAVYAIPSIVLMENAGRSACEVALRMLPKKGRRRVVCVCGKGNNGGDGMVVSRHLINKGVDVAVFLIGALKELKGDAKINAKILKNMGKKIITLKGLRNLSIFKRKLKAANLVVDAIFGIGLKDQVRQPYSDIINLINKSKKRVLSLDVPSGLDASTGKVLGVCIKATRTITFALPKTGMIKGQGLSYCGKVVIGDISIPPALLVRR